MDFIKRANLSFDLRKEEHKTVFNIINRQQLKTDYVVRAVLEYEKSHPVQLNKELIKEALMEVLKEIGVENVGIYESSKELNYIESDIPEEIFDIFNKM